VVDVDSELKRLSGDSVLADTDAAAVWLAERGVAADRTGVIGFDLGGAVAMVVASSRAVGAAVSVAGVGILAPLSDGLPALVDVAGELTMSVAGASTRDEDAAIPVAEVEKLRDAARHRRGGDRRGPVRRHGQPVRHRPAGRRRGVAPHAELVRPAPGANHGPRAIG